MIGGILYGDMNYECDNASVSSHKPSLDVVDGEISTKEVESAIRSLNCGKSARADGVTTEMTKYGEPCILDSFWFLCN